MARAADTSPARLIAHVDMDAFYASVEQLDNPELKGKPVIVGGIGARGVVSAASYEARVFGVRSAMPMYEARRRCPEGVYIQVRMSRYKEVSEQVFRVFDSFTPVIQGLSLDEAFLDLTGAIGSEDPVTLGRRIKKSIHAATGLTASVGLAPNKLVAKIISQQCKPDGLQHVKPEEVQTTLDPLPVTAMWGIGPRTGESLSRAKIQTIRDLRLAPEAKLKALFGSQALRFKALAEGRDDRPVDDSGGERSVSQETTFERDLKTLDELDPVLRSLTEDLCRILRKNALKPHTLIVKLRETDFSRHTRQRRFTPADASFDALYPIARWLLARWLEEHPGRALRLLGVGARDFSGDEQQELFDESRVRRERLEAASDAVRDRFGDSALRRGVSLDDDPD
ncbi:MAG TPA: DNA polymerase IV [Gammaproteobacteria bacterium]|nr:DNA polymerase IV [Gammaproteobacteria bacterium]